MLEIDVSLKGRPVRSYQFSQNAISIGRDPQSDIHLDNAGVSRRHAQIVLDGERIEVLDVGSSNGTFVNGYPAAERILAPGDIIQVGKFSLALAMKEAGAAAQAQANLDLDRFQGTIVVDGDSAPSTPAPAPKTRKEPKARQAPKTKTRTAKVKSKTPPKQGASPMMKVIMFVLVAAAFAAGFFAAQTLA